jgi:hypothetical protein
LNADSTRMTAWTISATGTRIAQLGGGFDLGEIAAVSDGLTQKAGGCRTSSRRGSYERGSVERR